MKVSKLLVVTSLLAAVAVISLQIKESKSAKVAEKPAESDNHDKSSESGHSHADEEGHDHKEEIHDQENGKHDHEHEDKHDHGDEGHGDEQVHKEDEHEDGHGHGHGEEENSSVGVGKGITVADEENGIKLSAEAIKNFELKTVKLQGGGPWTISSSAILYSGEEINIYRLRDGFYKRIDFILLSKESGSVLVKGKELAGGDEVVVHGVGFLRTAELVAFGGAPEGHSH